jgi:hypothetical protein
MEYSHWTPRLAIGAGTVLAASFLFGSPASAYVAQFSCAPHPPPSTQANYSWADGTATTTVYYNNHCSHKVDVTLHFITTTGSIVNKCWHTPAGKNHKVWNYRDLNDITKGC